PRGVWSFFTPFSFDSCRHQIHASPRKFCFAPERTLGVEHVPGHLRSPPMCKRFTTPALLALALVLALPRFAAAWHNDGHMAVARIAWLQLTDNDKAQVSKILKKHPHFDVFLSVGRPKDFKEPEWVFVQAAIWPDWVRDPRGKDVTPEMRKAIKKDFNKP